MGLRQKVDNHPVVFFLSALLSGFVAGLGCYHGILKIAHLQVVPESELSSDRPIDLSPPPVGEATADEELVQSEPAKSESSASAAPGMTLDAPTELTKSQVIDGIVFRGPRCLRDSDECLRCSALATSSTEEKKVALVPMKGDRQSRIIDQDGNQHRPRSYGFGSQLYSFGFSETVLVRGVPSRFVLQFCKTDQVRNVAPLFEFLIKDGQRIFEVRFRNVPIS